MSDNLEMFCHQCQMSAPEGCGAKGQSKGTCGKTSTLALLQDTMFSDLKALAPTVTTRTSLAPILARSIP